MHLESQTHSATSSEGLPPGQEQDPLGPARAMLRLLLQGMVDKNASDLHMSVGAPPSLRIDGKLFAVKIPALSMDDTAQMAQIILNSEQQEKLASGHEIDLSFGFENIARFRAFLRNKELNRAGYSFKVKKIIPGIQNIIQIQESKCQPQDIHLLQN